ncbi:radical SAM protein [Desulfococcaceae bacterium HSG8]|nr:radical SAM protein [Desulfococcaceae bacterium HSG8]
MNTFSALEPFTSGLQRKSEKDSSGSHKKLGYLMDESRATRLVTKVTSSTYHPLHVTRAEVFLTSACNMDCCYCKSTHHPMPEWDENSLYTLLETLGDRGTGHVQWTGGEVTTHPGLRDFISFSHKAGMNNSISTNGTAAPAVYLALAEAGVSHFSISFDHPEQSFFDNLTRTKGQWSEISETIGQLCRCRKRDYRIVINTILTKASVLSFMENNAKWLREFLKWCMNIGADDFKFLPVSTERFANLFPNRGMRERFVNICASYVPPEYGFFHYRMTMLQQGGHGLHGRRHHTCFHFLDDRTYDSLGAYPCIIHLREGGKRLYYHSDPPGKKQEKAAKFFHTDRAANPICHAFCFDVYRALSDRVKSLIQQENRYATAENEMVSG